MVVAHAGMFVAACKARVVLSSSNAISGVIFCSRARTFNIVWYLIIGSTSITILIRSDRIPHVMVCGMDFG